MHVFVQLLADLWKLNMCENHRINIKHETSQNNKNMGRSIVNSNHGNNEKSQKHILFFKTLNMVK